MKNPMTSANIIPLKPFMQKKQRLALGHYFQQLTFGQLINECAPIVKQLESDSCNDTSLVKATELLKEYKRRLESDHASLQGL